MPNLLYDIGGRLTIIFVNIALHSLDNKVSCSMVLYSTVQYSTVQYHTHLYTSFRMIISYKSIRFLLYRMVPVLYRTDAECKNILFER